MRANHDYETWVFCPQPRPQAALRLFCFPYAGGGATMFLPWLEELPAEIELCALTLPGREGRLFDAPFTHLTPLTETLAEVLSPHLDVPFAFFGHSIGALVCFELARTLRRRNSTLLAHLFVAGRNAPQLPNIDDPICHLQDAAFLAQIRQLGGTPDEILHNVELMELLLPALRADFALSETYHHTADEPLACPISAFGGNADPETTPERLRAWSEQTCAGFALHMFPGDHFFLHSARSQVLQALLQDLRLPTSYR